MLALRVARRYLFARSLPTAVNVLTLVSALGIALGTAALVVVLSVFNGFHALISDVFAQVDPHIRIEAALGSRLPAPDSLVAALPRLPALQGQLRHSVRVLEGRAVLQYRERQALVRLRGVEPAFAQASAIRAATFAGRYDLDSLPQDSYGFARLVVGTGVAQTIGLNLLDEGTPLQLFGLSARSDLLARPDEALRSRAAFAAGVFQVQQEYDSQWVLADLGVAQSVFDAAGQASALELTLAQREAAPRVAQALRAALPAASYRVLTGPELHPTLFQIYETEKLAGYLIVSLMLLLMASTVAGTLTLIVIDKRADLAVLQTMGATRGQLAGIVLALGLGIGLLALGLGLGAGLLLVWTQHHWGWLKMSGGESFLVDAFPVQVQLADVLATGATVLALALLACLPPAWRASRDAVVPALTD